MRSRVLTVQGTLYACRAILYIFQTPINPVELHISYTSFIQHSIKQPSCQESPSLGSHLDTLPRIQLRPHIEIKTRSTPAVRPSSVKVNNIVDPCSTTVDNPVVTIKRRSVAYHGLDASCRSHAVHLVGERFELGATASVVVSYRLCEISLRNLRCSLEVRRFPFLYLLPSSFVDSIVDWHNGLHIRYPRIITLALHRLEEHLLRRIHPVS